MTMGPSCMSSSAGLAQSLWQKVGMGASMEVQAPMKRPRWPTLLVIRIRRLRCRDEARV